MSDPTGTQPAPEPAPEPTPTTTPNPEPTTTPSEAAAPLTAESIKLPEGFEAAPELMEKYVGLMNDQSLTPEGRAQGLVDLYGEAMKAASEKSSALWQQMQDQWRSEVEKDPTIGGAKLEATMQSIGKLIDEYPEGEQLREVFDLTGVGNNPVFIRFMHGLASKLNEGQPTPGQPPAQAKSIADRIYDGGSR